MAYSPQLKTIYENGHSDEQITKIRGLGKTTIFEHLIRWYADGGDLAIEKYVSAEEERQILAAVATAGSYQFLGKIKEQLPESIGYEKIKLVLARIQRDKKQ